MELTYAAMVIKRRILIVEVGKVLCCRKLQWRGVLISAELCSGIELFRCEIESMLQEGDVKVKLKEDVKVKEFFNEAADKQAFVCESPLRCKP